MVIVNFCTFLLRLCVDGLCTRNSYFEIMICLFLVEKFGHFVISFLLGLGMMNGILVFIYREVMKVRLLASFLEYFILFFFGLKILFVLILVKFDFSFFVIFYNNYHLHHQYILNLQFFIFLLLFSALTFFDQNQQLIDCFILKKF